VVGDFPDLNLRSINTLKIDEAHIGLHAQHSERINKKSYDNVVIATKYIGPMVLLRQPDEISTGTVTQTSSGKTILLANLLFGS
jgi:hypothetical protein